MSTNQMNDYFSPDFNQDNLIDNNIYQSVNLESLQQKKSIHESENETALESKLGKSFEKRPSLTLLSSKNLSKFRESLKEIINLDNKACQNIEVRELPKISQEAYEKFKNSNTDQDTLDQLYNSLTKSNCNFKSVECGNSLGGLTPLTYLVESSFSMNFKKAKEINDKYKILKPYIYNYRTINGDGNCFYRAVMFKYLEIMVLNKQIETLQNITYDVYNSFNSEELKSRLVIGNINIKPTLTLKLLILITDLLKKGDILSAHNILIKSFCICRKFDYAIIFYFRYILYDYIKKNEEKTYLKSFPIKLGNLLPSQYETEDGKFLYELFYNNYLLKFYTDAEKIVIYLTPFVLGIPLNVIIFDDNEEEILQTFKWEEGQGLNLSDEIYLLNRKNHYEIVYTQKENEKYKNIFQYYENNQRSVILSDIDKYLKLYANDNNDKILLEAFNEGERKNNPKTMIIQRNNINKEKSEKKPIDINKAEMNPKTIINNNDLINQNKINNNNIDANAIQGNKKVLNPNCTVKKNYKDTNNINNNDPLNNNQNQIPNNLINNNNNIINNNNNGNMTKNQNIKNNMKINNINQISQPNYPNNANSIPNQINNKQINSQPIKTKQNKEFYNQKIPLDNNKNLINNKNEDKNLKIYPNQTTSKKNNRTNQNNNKVNVNLIDEKYLKANNNISNNQNNKMNKKENAHIQEPKEVGMYIPGNIQQINKNNNHNNPSGKSNNNSNKFICRNCKNPLNNINLILCQNCFKKEIINEVYSSYLQSLNQKYPPENLIEANITIINFKNEKRIYNLDNALNEYNNIFKNEKLERKDIILELKKRVCIACLNEIKSKNSIELPCKCRICSFEHLNEYLSYYQNFNVGFECRCKVTYTNQMMMELIHLRGLNRDIQARIKYFFQKKLDSCCCICGKSSNIVGQSNTLISLENSYYNNFIHSLLHNFCKNCIKYQNTEFFCQICQIKHFWNSN